MSVLAERYASPEMRLIWSPENKVRAERRLWLTVLRYQAPLLGIKESVITDYERVLERIDLASIEARELKSRHDLKARIDEFNELAGHQSIHLGMTSRDLTENIEIWQVKQSLELVRARSATLLYCLGRKAKEYSNLAIVGRSHNVPAQVTTLGKKFATIAEELLFGFEHLEQLLRRIPLRGFKGPVGTSQDMKDLIEDVELLETHVAKSLGFSDVLDSAGQISPRSIDLEVIGVLTQISAAASNFAINIRLLAGFELVSEGFAKEQVGSSAMPHKMNSRSSERINGLAVVLRGYLLMISEISGDQWHEGDVSDSVVRRVALSDAFFALDGIIETTLTILSEMVVFQENIKRELTQHLPFLATTKVLMAAVKAGAGRESAHQALRELSLEALAEQRAGRNANLFELIAKDSRIPLDESALQVLLSDPLEFTGNAASQIERVLVRIEKAIASIPSAKSYKPTQIR
jgi:adenylosuccinate lyase